MIKKKKEQTSGSRERCSPSPEASPPDYFAAELVSSFFVSPMASPMLEPLFHSLRLETKSMRCDFLETLAAEISEARVPTRISVFSLTISGLGGCTVEYVSSMCLLGISYPIVDCSGDSHFDGRHPCSD